MTGLDKREPPRCWSTGAVKTICCAGRDEGDQPDTIERQEAGVLRGKVKHDDG